MKRMHTKEEIQCDAIEALSEEGIIVSDGALSATTVEQSSYNYEESFADKFESEQLGLTVTVSYAKFVVINKVLYIVGTFKLKNESDSTITLSNGQRFLVSDTINLPQDLASKIYDINGTPVSEPGTTGIALIASDNTYIETSLYTLGYASRKNAYAYMNHGGGGRINFQAFTGESVSIAAGQEVGTEFRYILVL